MQRSACQGIDRVVCNEDVWYFRLGARLGWYRRDLTHSAIKDHVMAVPRRELAYWQARLAELKAGTLAEGADKAMFIHEGVHCRQMAAWPFWLFGLRYVLGRRFRRRMEEEAYTVHLTYLARCCLPIEAPYWIQHFQDLYFGAFSAKRAREAFDRMAGVIRATVPNAMIVETAESTGGVVSYTPWLRDRST